MIPLLEATEWVQCSVHPPSSFIRTHRQRLLPSWQSEPQSVVIILQRCAVSLAHCTAQTDYQKDVLRDRFLHIGKDIRHHIRGICHEVELFDPKSGYPVISSPGSLHLDDVAVACHMLHYAVSTQGTCTYLLHPQWRDAVYPSTLISDAPIEKVQEVLSTLVLPNGYAEAPPIRRNLQFCSVQEAIAPTVKTVKTIIYHLATRSERWLGLPKEQDRLYRAFNRYAFCIKPSVVHCAVYIQTG